MSSKYQIIVEAIINEKTLQTSLDELGKKAKINIKFNPVTQEQISEIKKKLETGLQDVKVNFNVGEVKKSAEKVKDEFKKAAAISAQSLEDAMAKVFSGAKGKQVADVMKDFNRAVEAGQIGTEKYKMTSLSESFDADNLLGYNFELQKTEGSIQRIIKGSASVIDENEVAITKMSQYAKVVESVADKIKKWSLILDEVKNKNASGALSTTGGAAQVANVEKALKSFESGTITEKQLGLAFKELNVYIRQYTQEVNEAAKATKALTDQQSNISKFKNALETLQQDNPDAMKNQDVAKNMTIARQELERYVATGKNVEKVEMAFRELRTSINGVNQAQKGLLKEGDTWATRMQKILGKIAQWGIGTSLIYGTIQKFREMIDNIKELDLALTELQKVTDLAGNSLEAFTNEAFRMGETIGRTGTETVNAVTEFAKAGYDLPESMQLGKTALLMTNIADGIDNVDEATSSLIAVLRGYNFEADRAMSITDSLNEVSNTTATSFEDLADGLRRTSGVLSQTGTSVEELIGLLTGGFESLRNMEKVSSGLIQISSRLRGVTEDGEEVAGLLPKLQDEFMEIAGISILDPETGGLRDTYSILKDMAEVFPTLNTLEREYLETLAAGSRQTVVLRAILNHWEDVEGAVQSATEATGSAMRENEKFLNSIQGKLNEFTSAWQKLSADTINSETVKAFVDFGTEVLKLVDSLGLLKTALIAIASYNVFNIFLGGYIEKTKIAIAVTKMLGTEIAVTKAIAGGLVAIAIAAAVAGLTIAYKELTKSAQDYYKVFKEGAETQRTSLQETSDLLEEYRLLAEKTEKTREEQERLIDIQTILNDKYGTATTAVDGYTAAITNNTEAINENIDARERQSVLAAESFLTESAEEYRRAKEILETPDYYDIQQPEVAMTPYEYLEILNKEIAEGFTGFNENTIKNRDDLVAQIGALENIVLEYEDMASWIRQIRLESQGAFDSSDVGVHNAITESLSDLGETASETVMSLESLYTAMNEISNQINTTMGIYDSYLENQELSFDQVMQLKSLYGSEYINFLTLEGDTIRLNTEALKAATLAKIQDLIVDARRIGAMKEVALLQAYLAQTMRQFAESENEAMLKQAEEATQQAKNIADEARKIQEEAYQDLLQKTIDMLKQKKQAEIDALEAQIDAYKKIIDARKELLEQQKKEHDYQRAKEDKQGEIATIESELAEIQFDTSEEGMRKRLELEEELAAKKDELAEMEYDNSIEMQENALDQDFENYQDNLQNKIDELENYLKETGTITQEAIDLLANKSSEFYEELLEWNRRFGTGVDEDIVEAWKRAFDAVYAYQLAVANVGTSTSTGEGGGTSETVTETTPSGGMIGQKIKTKSSGVIEGYSDSGASEYAGLLPYGKTYMVKDYKNGAAAPYKVYDSMAGDYYWIKSSDITAAGGGGFGSFHTGLDKGFVGGVNSNEQFAKLLKGELVINPKQMNEFMTNIFPKTVQVASGGLGGLNIEKFMDINVNGSLDSSVIPDIKMIVNKAVEELNKIVKQRGITRNANVYSV